MTARAGAGNSHRPLLKSQWSQQESITGPAAALAPAWPSERAGDMSDDPGQSALLPDLMRQADAAYAAGDWAGAERLCGQALRAQADHVPALSLLGIIKAQSRRTEEAAVLLQRVAAAMP